MKLIRFLYILIYKAFTSDLSARKAKVVCSEVEEEIVKPVLGNDTLIEVGDGIDMEPMTGEGKGSNFYGFLQRDNSQLITNRSGVYTITNLIDNKCYIGSSVRLGKRYVDHRSSLRDGNHKNSYLQNAFIKYGSDSFIFKIIEYCERDEVIEREQYWIDNYKKEDIYNFSLIAGKSTFGIKKLPHQTRLGHTHSEKTREKLKNSARLRDNSNYKGKKAGKSWNRGTKGLMKVNITSFKPQQFSIFSINENILYKGEGIAAFTREKKLTQQSIRQVLNGERAVFQGWTNALVGFNYKVINWTKQKQVSE